MLHEPAFAHHLLDTGGSVLQPLLERIFSGGARDGYTCYSSGGDFVVGCVPTNQTLHADLVLKKCFDTWLPAPMVSVNYVVHDINQYNGPMRIIPATQLDRGEVPEQLPRRWENSCLCPLYAGAAIVRDVRTLHSGTANRTLETRYLPSVEYVSADFRATNRGDCFPPWPSMTRAIYDSLRATPRKRCEEIVDWRGGKTRHISYIQD